jgi:hypothetical protein
LVCAAAATISSLIHSFIKTAAPAAAVLFATDEEAHIPLWLDGRIGVTEPQTSTAVVLGHAAAAVSEATVALRDLQ